MFTQSAGAGHSRKTRAGAGGTHKRSVLRVTAWAALAALTVPLLLWLAPLESVIDALGDLNPLWLIAAVVLELVSCVSYVVLFRELFEPVAGRSPGKLAWLGLGAGAVLPGGDVAGLAASSVPLHREGVPTRWLVLRSGVLLLLVNAVSVSVAGVAGALLLSGAGTGPHDLLLAGLPILVSVSILAVVASIPLVVRRSGRRAPGWAVALADAVGETGSLLRRPPWRLLGAVGYPLLDMAALWAACAATGHPPSVAALIVAYNVGYLASVLPVPAGIGVLDGGLAAALIIYGASPTAAVAAVLVYHALAVWLPAVGGVTAFVELRRERRHTPSQAAVVRAHGRWRHRNLRPVQVPAGRR